MFYNMQKGAIWIQIESSALNSEFRSECNV